MSTRLVALGEVMLDISTEAIVPGERRHAPVRVRAGGSPVTAALAAAAEGVPSAVVGRVGADFAAHAVRAALEAAGVEARLDVDPELPTGTFFEADAGRTVVADRGANARLEVGEIAAEAVLVSGYFLLRDEGEGALEHMRADWLAVDAGSSRLLSEGALARMAGANALFVNADEARALTGQTGQAALDALAPSFRLVCVKLGVDGAIAALDGTTATATPPERVHEQRAGAGDAFAGALLASLLLGRSLGEALERACAAGARMASG
jgi:sugar/nucleoside kinase (ribokinase family)